MTAAGPPLLDSKLHVPRRRRGVVARARLDRRLAPATFMALPIAAWELSVGVFMTAEGFRRPAGTDDPAEVATPARAFASTSA